MMNSNCISRRRLILSMAAASAYPWGLVMGDDGLLAATPSDAEGPFYPVELPDDTDNNLVKVVGRENTAPGTLAYLQGRVMDRAGQRIDGARVEIWQCDHGGVYHHPEDGGEPNLDFQGFGAVSTGRDGEYLFRTMRPVPYTGRTPHIHFRVIADGFDTLTTQLYVAEEASRNAEDGLYNRHSSEEQKLVTTAFSSLGNDPASPVEALFNIVLA
jgi:protocatechuate 3,4-dioxygenase beta subunit